MGQNFCAIVTLQHTRVHAFRVPSQDGTGFPVCLTKVARENSSAAPGSFNCCMLLVSVATKRDVAWIMRDFPAGRTHVYFWRDMNETCTTCMYSVMAIRADSQFRAVGNMVSSKFQIRFWSCRA